MKEEKKIPCHFPWTSMYISPNGDVKHCCSTNLNRLGNLKDQTVDEIWNGKLYKQIRSKIDKGNFDGAFCNPNCEGLRTGEGFPFPKKNIASKSVEENQDLALKNFESGKNNADHLPTMLSIEFSDNCNLRCVMCFYEFKPPYNYVTGSAMEKLLAISSSAQTIALMGGEVFMNKQDLKFIDSYEPQEGASFGFVTNATFLNEAMVERIKKFKNMWMQISIDGTEKEVYEKVRKRGKWEVVDANIHRMVNASNDLISLGYKWDITLAYVVMFSNFRNLPHAVQYAINLNIPIDFNPVKGFHLYDENVFIYKKPFKKIGDSKKYMTDTYSILEKNKTTYEHHERVLNRLRDIDDFLSKPKINISPTIIKIIRFFVPEKKDESVQGVSKLDWKVGHVIEVYYNYKTGNTSLKNTLSYLFLKISRSIKTKFSKRKK